jgi:hypothetical protein
MLSNNYKNILALKLALNNIGWKKEAGYLVSLLKTASDPDAAYKISRKIKEILVLIDKIIKILGKYSKHKRQNIKKENSEIFLREAQTLASYAINIADDVEMLSDDVIWYYELKMERLKDSAKSLSNRMKMEFNNLFNTISDEIYTRNEDEISNRKIIGLMLKLIHLKLDDIDTYMREFGVKEAEYSGEKIQFNPYSMDKSRAEADENEERTMPGTGSPYSLPYQTSGSKEKTDVEKIHTNSIELTMPTNL